MQCKAQAQNAPEKLHNCQESVADWERQLQSLKRLLPVEASYFKLIKDDIPTVEKSLAALTEKLEPARTKAQEVSTHILSIPFIYADYVPIHRL